MIESVEHQLFSCTNATRIWDLYNRLTGVRISSLFEAISCGSDVGHELVKFVLTKSLLQINRSKDKTDREIISDCIYFLGLEVEISGKKADQLKSMMDKLKKFRKC